MSTLVLCLLLGQLSHPQFTTRERAESTLRSAKFTVAQWQALRQAQFADPEVASRVRRIVPTWTRTLVEDNVRPDVKYYPDIDYVGLQYWDPDKGPKPKNQLFRTMYHDTRYGPISLYLPWRDDTMATTLQYAQATGDFSGAARAIERGHDAEGKYDHLRTFSLLGIKGLRHTTNNWCYLCPHLFLRSAK